MLIEKYREIRTLEAQNATAAMENQRRKDRIERLRTNSSEQEMEGVGQCQRKEGYATT